MDRKAHLRLGNGQMSMAAIVIDHVSRRYGAEARPAVDDVSLAVEAGEFVTLLGPSGCGKTTLLKMINRLVEPTSGRILVNGEDTSAVSPTALRRRIGYVIQQTGLFPHMRIEDNIGAVPRLLGWDKARVNARIDELLDLIGLPASYRQRYPRQLSGGEQQRVGVARALASDPPIVLMDEPFGAIDAINRLRLQDEMLRIQTVLHKTIMFVTHDVEEAFRLGDRIVVMREGRIVQEGAPLDLATAPHDAFVSDLIGAGDMLRRMSMLSVAQAQLQPIDSRLDVDRGPHVLRSADLRSALGLLLQSGAPALIVVDESGQPCGKLDFAAMRAVLGQTQ
jgi:osmoprotectant transport system ATP-binding protein